MPRWGGDHAPGDAAGLARRSFLAAAACVLAAFAFTTASHFTLGELGLDDASTFFVALRPARDVVAVAMAFHSQPPLFYLALHEWLRLGDSEPVLRTLPLLFMVAAALTLLAASWLPPVARVVGAALLLLTPYSDYLTAALRPYALSVWLSLWSYLLLARLLTGARRGAAAYIAYTAVTVLLSYTVAMASWVLLAHGLCAVGAVAVAAVRRGARRAVADCAALLVSLTVVAVAYLPYAINVWALQGQLGHPSLRATIAAATNPRFFISGPAYLLALPAGLGYAALALVAAAAWLGAMRRDPLIAVLFTLVIVQIAMTHGFLEGRSGFSFRYLAPAYPALCLLAGLGADAIVSRLRAVNVMVPAGATIVLAASVVVFARAPHGAPAGVWRQVGDDLRRFDGQRFVLFDTGYEAQPLQYEVFHDPGIRIMSDPGSGWATGGRQMTPAYVAGVVDRHAAPGTMFFYQFDPVAGAGVFTGAFAPAMARHGCARVYQREVSTYARAVAGDGGALLYGYVCHGV